MIWGLVMIDEINIKGKTVSDLALEFISYFLLATAPKTDWRFVPRCIKFIRYGKRRDGEAIWN